MTRGILVSNITLSYFARHYCLHDELILGTEALAGGINLSQNVLADAFEARIAAVFAERQ